MRKTVLTGASLGLVLILGACSKPEAPAGPDLTAVQNEVKAVQARWSSVAGSRDAAAFSSFYAADANVFLPETPPLRGKAAITAAMKEAFADPNFAISFSTSRVIVSKDGLFACAESRFIQTSTDPATRRVVPAKGNSLTCFAKQENGEWKAVSDIAVVEPEAEAGPAAAPAG